MSSAKPEGRLKVVLDTNVYFSAFHSTRGVPHELLRRAVDGEYSLLVSPAIIKELAGILRREEWPEADIIRQLKALVRIAIIVEPRFTLAVLVVDPDGNRILECAQASSADLIVSGDHHLTALKNFRGIGIVRPVDFLRSLAT